MTLEMSEDDSAAAGGEASRLGGGSGLLFCTSFNNASKSLLSRFLPLLSATPSVIRLSSESCDLEAEGLGAGSLGTGLALPLGAAAMGALSSAPAKGSSDPEDFLVGVLAEDVAFTAPLACCGCAAGASATATSACAGVATAARRCATDGTAFGSARLSTALGAGLATTAVGSPRPSAAGPVIVYNAMAAPLQLLASDMATNLAQA